MINNKILSEVGIRNLFNTLGGTRKMTTSFTQLQVGDAIAYCSNREKQMWSRQWGLVRITNVSQDFNLIEIGNMSFERSNGFGINNNGLIMSLNAQWNDKKTYEDIINANTHRLMKTLHSAQENDMVITLKGDNNDYHFAYVTNNDHGVITTTIGEFDMNGYSLDHTCNDRIYAPDRVACVIGGRNITFSEMHETQRRARLENEMDNELIESLSKIDHLMMTTIRDFDQIRYASPTTKSHLIKALNNLIYRVRSTIEESKENQS